VCKKAKNKKKNMKKFKRNLEHSYIKNGSNDLRLGWYVDLPTWWASLQQIWLNSGKRFWSYMGVKITSSFFLSIYSWCGTLASWAIRYTTMCLDYAFSNISYQTLPLNTLDNPLKMLLCFTFVLQALSLLQ